MENFNSDLQARERAFRRIKAFSGFYRHLMVYILVNAFLLAIKYFNLDEGEKFFTFNTFTTAFFWGFGLAFHALGVFSNSVLFGRAWEEKKMRELMEKDKKQKWE